MIALGFSKDHRPDLKQYMIGLGVNSEGVPLFGKPLKGNTSDKAWNKQVFTAFHAGLADYALSIMVADSQAITIPNLKLAKGIAFISRLPDTFALTEQIKQKAWANNAWIELGRLAEAKRSATYRIQSFVDQIELPVCGSPFFLIGQSQRKEYPKRYHQRIGAFEKRVRQA